MAHCRFKPPRASAFHVGTRLIFVGAVGGGFFVEMLTAIFAKAHYWPFPLPPLKLQKAEKELLSGTENTSKNPLV